MSERLAEILDGIRTFVSRRDWEQYHDPKNLAMAIGSEAGELLELFRWIHSDDADAIRDEPEKLRRVREEIGDVAICLLMLCDRLDIDFFEAVERKLEVNREKFPVEDARDSGS